MQRGRGWGGCPSLRRCVSLAARPEGGATRSPTTSGAGSTHLVGGTEADGQHGEGTKVGEERE
jgi:hypothetical protein